MRNIFFLFLLYGTISVWAQVKTFMSTEIENDFLNARGRGTDQYYTGGNRVIVWHENDRYTLRSFGIGIMQQAYTPSNLQETDPSRLDYPYAGLLFFSAHILVMPPEKKWRFYTTLSLGTTGAKSGVASWQRTIHRMIGDEMPRGWYLLQPVTCYIQVESQVFFPILSFRNWRIEFLNKWEGGNFFNRFNYGVLLFWKNLPAGINLHFNTLTDQVDLDRRGIVPSFYLMTQTVAVLRNRILEESLFRENTSSNLASHVQYVQGRMILVSGGVGFTKGRVGCHYTQQWQSKETKLSDSHSFGAVRFTFQLSKTH